jgi:uncharacterized protein
LAQDYYIMETPIIGRDTEIDYLNKLLKTSKACLVAVYGRRRVGKTYLLRTHLKKEIVLEYAGVHNVSTELQLERFTEKLAKQLNNKKPLPLQKNWFVALDTLQQLLKPKLRRKKIVVFLDEFPWMQTPKSNFLAAFENFWNTWGSLQPNLVLVLCGSSASWMINNVVRNKGGLHNRITHKIALQPFTLYETEQFLIQKKIHLSPYQITQIYMAMGGIPHYLDHIEAGLSATQVIDAACFTKLGFLYNEFTDLYTSLFATAERHIKVIRTLAQKPMGLNRNELIKICKLKSGGSTTNLFEELSASGFITPYIPLGKQTKDAIYKLTDEFSLFYLKFMENNRNVKKHTWEKLQDTPIWKSWSGLAFENICLKHSEGIKEALGIAGIYSETAIWKSKAVMDGNAAQIDLVINRRDNCMNLCEIKFYEDAFMIDKKYATVLENKKRVFKAQTKTKKHLFTTLITANGFEHNAHSLGLVDHTISLEQLFLQKSL